MPVGCVWCVGSGSVRYRTKALEETKNSEINERGEDDIAVMLSCGVWSRLGGTKALKILAMEVCNDQKIVPTCIYGTVIDPHGMHTFSCVRVSKRAMHDLIRNDTAPVICALLKTAGIIGKGSRVDIELKCAVKGLPGLHPLDSFFRPVPSLK